MGVDMKASGTFEVQAEPEPPYHEAEGISLGRMVFRKKFSGDLKAESTVQVLTARTAVPTSAAYVGIERIVGTLDDATGTSAEGSFVDGQHHYTIDYALPDRS